MGWEGQLGQGELGAGLDLLALLAPAIGYSGKQNKSQFSQLLLGLSCISSQIRFSNLQSAELIQENTNILEGIYSAQFIPNAHPLCMGCKIILAPHYAWRRDLSLPSHIAFQTGNGPRGLLFHCCHHINCSCCSYGSSVYRLQHFWRGKRGTGSVGTFML